MQDSPLDMMLASGKLPGIWGRGIRKWTWERSKDMPFWRHVALRTEDLERSRAFYEKILGLKFLRYIYDECFPAHEAISI